MADFLLKQHLRLSPNAQIKNVVLESLTEDPEKSTWKPGRIWYNITEGKFKCIKHKTTNADGVTDELVLEVFGSDILGTTFDGSYYPDGLYDFEEQTRISDAVDELNEALKDIAPSEATPLSGFLIPKNITTFEGFISKPDNDDLIFFDVGEYTKNIITANNLTLEIPTVGVMNKDVIQQQFAKADQGILKLNLDNNILDSLPLKDLWFEDAREFADSKQGFEPDIIQTVTQNNIKIEKEINPNKDLFFSSNKFIKITYIERYNNFKKWQRGTGLIYIGYDEYDQPLLNKGEHKVTLIHDELSYGPFSASYKFFIDDSIKENNKIYFSETLFYLYDIGDISYISGIPYIKSNIIFALTLNAKNLFRYTFNETPLLTQSDETDISDIKWNRTNLSEKDAPNYSDDLILDKYQINFIGNTCKDSQELTLTLTKPTQENISITNTLQLPINTSNLSSSNLKELFIDERYRLPIKNYDSIDEFDDWDSTQQLTTGNCQVFQHKLQKPILLDDTVFETSKYTDTVKDKLNIPDHTSLLDDESNLYLRYFKSTKPNSNGLLVFNGNINVENIKLSIKLPGVTGWLDLLTMFDVEYFNNNSDVDGTGCQTHLVQQNDILEIEWSIGQLSTVDSDYIYIIKIEIFDNSIFTSIEEKGDGWL